MKHFHQEFLADKTYTIVGGSFQISQLFRLGGAREVKGIANADIVVFTGGADVHPSFYKEKPLNGTYTDLKRDVFEANVYDATKKQFRVGICRGGQFLNVMNGGRMWQDCDGHGIRGTHKLLYRMANGKTREVMVSSTHHQMMRPAEGGHVWGMANETTYRMSGSHSVPMVSGHNSDIEIVWYPKTKSLCFQPHPEYCLQDDTDCADLFFECLQRAMTTKH